MLINVLTFWHRYVREKMTGYAKAKRFEKNATRIGGEKKRNKGKRQKIKRMQLELLQTDLQRESLDAIKLPTITH